MITVRHSRPLGCWVGVKFHHLCVILVIISLVISTSSSPATSYSSSSLSTFEGESPNEKSDVIPPSKPSAKLDIDVVPSAAKTMVTEPGVECGCDVLQQVIDEVRQTKEVCIDTAFAVNVHVKKVGKLQIAVDGLASMRDTNHADEYVAPTSPSTHIVSSSDEELLTSSSLDLVDIVSDEDTESDYDEPNNDEPEVETPPSLEGVHLVIMEAPEVIPRDCLEVQQKVGNVTGVYTILPDGCGQPFQVFCDMSTSGGGWTVLQRRLDGKVSFARLWGAYRRGFGNLLTEFWLGLDKMSRLTSQDDYELRIDLQDFNGTKASAEYERMMISDYRSNYRLHVGAFKPNGSAGDSLSYHNHMPFTTTDRDNDLAKKNCAELYSGGGWWFNGCLYSNLNGIYLGPEDDDFALGVTWFEFAGFRKSLKLAEMKVRPVP